MFRKAQASPALKIVITLVVLLALALVVYLAFIKPSGQSAVALFNSVDSCISPMVGKAGLCDCAVDPIGVCPTDTEAKINTNCPNLKYGACKGAAYVDAAIKAKKEYQVKIDSVQKAQGVKLTPDMERAIQADYFGQCCRGAKAPGT